MAGVMKYWDGSQWVEFQISAPQGPQGPTGATGPMALVAQASEPTATNVLWVDTDAVSSTSAISPTIIDAAGDLIVGSGPDAATRLQVGATDQVLTADSTAPNGLRWSTQVPSVANITINGIPYVMAPNGRFSGGMGTQGMNGNWTYYMPFEVSRPVTLDSVSIAVNGTGTATEASISVHSCSFLLVPTGLTKDCGTVSLTSGGLKTVSNLQTVLPIGMYLYRVQANGTWTPLCAIRPGFSHISSSAVSSNVRMFANITGTYSATAPNPGLTINGLVGASSGGQYDIVMGTFV